jgi:DNA-binding NarL/FixJ family response regulator
MEELTPRQAKILLLIGMGFDVTQISHEFHLKEERINMFIDTIKQKTGMQSWEELQKLAQSMRDAE